MINHTILMAEKSGENQVIYKDVKSYTGLYGCLIRLELSNGDTATFDKANWEMFDLTPTRGWNGNPADIKVQR